MTENTIAALISCLHPLLVHGTVDETAREIYRRAHLRTGYSSASHADPGEHLHAEEVFGKIDRTELGWTLARGRSSGHGVFVKDGLHLEVPSHLIQASGALRLPAIRDRFTPGFAALLSSRPVPVEGVRVYIPVPYSAARQVGQLLAQELPDLIERFVLKALTQPSEYPRSDAFTLFISPVDLEVVLKFLALENFAERFCFAPRYSMFARAETSGVAWLEGTSSRSSGFERANCIARAYHLYSTDEEELELEGLIRDELADAGIDPGAIHLYKSRIGR